MRSGGQLGAILGKELLQTFRDRSILILVFLMPLALAGITSLAFSGLDSGGAARIGVVDGDGGVSAGVLVDEVLPRLTSGGSPLVTLKRYGSDGEARRAVADGTVDAAIVIPSGFTSNVQGVRPSRLVLLTGGTDSIGAPVARAVLQGFAAQIGTNQLSLRLVASGPGATEPTDRIIAAASAQRSAVDISDELSGAGTLSAASFFAPSMVVLALFFCGQMFARGLVAERGTRTLARILVADVRPTRILLAKYLMAFGTGLLSAVVVLGTFAALGANFGNVGALILLVLASAAAMIAVSSLPGLLAHTEDQAARATTVAIFALAIVGGNFVPLSRTSGALSTLSLFTPNGWAVRGFADLSVATDPLATMAPTLLALMAFTLAAGLPALWLSQRTLRSAGA